MERRIKIHIICDKEVRDRGLLLKGGQKGGILATWKAITKLSRFYKFLTPKPKGGNNGTDTSQDG